MEQLSGAITIFCCYAYEDIDLLHELKSHLSSLQRQNVVSVWDDGGINAGTEWRSEIKDHLNHANIILLLLSPNFIASDYCYSTQLQYALERHERKEACVIPVILRPFNDWEAISPGSIKLGDLQPLPKNARAVTTWDNHDLAWKDVAKGISKVINKLLEKSSIDQPNMLNQQQPVSEAVMLQKANLYADKRKKISSHKIGKLVRGVGQRVQLSILLLALTLMICGVFIRWHIQSGSSSDIATVPLPSTWNLLINNDNGWDESPPECKLENGVYDIIAKEQDYCLNDATLNSQHLASLHNYTYEIQESILRGQQGGITFCRASINSKHLKTNHAPYYYFGITIDGKYIFLYDDGNGNNSLIDTSSPYVNTGLGRFNTLSVNVYNKEITLSINTHKVDTYKETTTYPCNGGVLGVELTASPLDSMKSTEAVYKDTRVWGP